MYRYQPMRSPLTSDPENKTYKLEAALTKKVLEYLGSQPDIKFDKISDRYNIGISDIIASVGGIYTAIELKAKNGEATMAQIIFIDDVIKSGGIGGVCYCLYEVKQLVEAARRKSKGEQQSGFQ